MAGPVPGTLGWLPPEVLAVWGALQEASPGDGNPVERRDGDIACRELALRRHGEARASPGLDTSCAVAKAGTYQLQAAR